MQRLANDQQAYKLTGILPYS